MTGPRALILTLLIGGLTACFRSPWAIQRDYAETLEPRPLAAGADPNLAPRRILKVRVRVAEARKVLPGWKSVFETAVDDANEVLLAAAALRLEVVGYEDWPDAPGPDVATPSHLDALARMDPGADVDLVVGLADPLSLFHDQIDVLGAAYKPGRHIVLRGLAMPVERDHLKATLNLLPGEDVEGLLRRRRRHREAVILLHEVGHAAGADHLEGRSSIMASIYDHEAYIFGAPSRAMLVALSEGGRDSAFLTAGAAPDPAGAPAETEAALFALSGPNPSFEAIQEALALLPELDEDQRWALAQRLVELDQHEAARTAVDTLPADRSCALRRRLDVEAARYPVQDLPPLDRPGARAALRALLAGSQEARRRRPERLAEFEAAYGADAEGTAVARCFMDFEAGYRTEVCRLATERCEKSSVAWLLHGLVLSRRDRKAAVEALTRSVILDPDSKFAWRALSRLLPGPSGQETLAQIQAQAEAEHSCS